MFYIYIIIKTNDMKNVRVIVAPIVGGDIDRKDLERIEGQTFETMGHVEKELDCKYFEHYTLSDFMDLCNDSDSSRVEIDLDTHWIGYISLE